MSDISQNFKVQDERLHPDSLQDVKDWASKLTNIEPKSAILSEVARISSEIEDQWPGSTPRHPNRPYSLARP